MVGRALSFVELSNEKPGLDVFCSPVADVLPPKVNAGVVVEDCDGLLSPNENFMGRA